MRAYFFGIYAVLLLLVACITTPSGRKALVITSEEQEAQLGKQAFQEVLKKEELSDNERWNTILQRVGNRIAAVANRPDYQWRFVLIESKEQNAFALPGGKVAFYTGILPVCKNEAGLATVMGHEVAHATARHGGQRIAQAFGVNLGMAGLSALIGGKEGSTKKQLLMTALGIGAQVGVMLPFSRAQEAEADEIGLRYMAKAGYDPRAAPDFWSRFAKNGGSPPEFLSTHPSSQHRQAALQEQVQDVLPLYKQSPQYGLGADLIR